MKKKIKDKRLKSILLNGKQYKSLYLDSSLVKSITNLGLMEGRNFNAQVIFTLKNLVESKGK